MRQVEVGEFWNFFGGGKGRRGLYSDYLLCSKGQATATGLSAIADGSISQRFLVTNELTLTDEQFGTLYKKRWGVEEYHKSLKQNESIGSSPAHTER